MKLTSGPSVIDVRPYAGQRDLVLIEVRQPWATLIALGFKTFATVPSLPDVEPKIREGSWLAIRAGMRPCLMRHAVRTWEELRLVGIPKRGMFQLGSIMAVAQVELVDSSPGAKASESYTDTRIEDPAVLARKEEQAVLYLKNQMALWYPVPVRHLRAPKKLAAEEIRTKVAAATRPPDWFVKG